MNIDALLNDWELSDGATGDGISAMCASLKHFLPSDYLEFLKRHNGGEGFLGDNYLILWKVEELVPFNLEYEVEKYAPGIFLFGSSGGGDGYGFDTSQEGNPVVRIPFVGMDRRYAKVVANTFTDLLSKLAL